MNLYYEDDLVFAGPTPVLLHDGPLAQVWCGDARDVLPRIEKASTDLLVTDPPYGVSWRSNHRRDAFGEMANDATADRGGVAEILRAALRTVKPFRHAYVFGPTDLIPSLPLASPVQLIWDKTLMGLGDLGGQWGPAHEEITFAVHIDRPSAIKRGSGNIAARMRKGSVLRVRRPNSRGVRHPSEKPVELLRELIESSSRQGETVVDPFAGVGSTGVAAALAGRRSVLIELKPQYAEIAVQRVIRAEELADQGAKA